VQVRRSSDDALKSFTADEVTDGTLLSFVGTSGSDNGFVKTWYDQSVTNQAGDTATGNHAVQATAANQPKIVNAGALVTGGLDFDGTAHQLTLSSTLGITSAASHFAVINPSGGGADTLFDNRDSSVDGYRIATSSTTKINFDWLNSDVEIDRVSGQAVYYFNKTSSQTQSGANGGTLVTASESGSISVTTAPRIGARSFSSALNFFAGTINEFIVYNSDQTDNRTAIEANIGEAYSIDLPSGVDPGFDQVDGFVETWYDQSGNGNDAVQATASEQPKIVDAGSLIADGIDFDGSDDTLTAASVSGFGATISMFSASVRDSGGAGVLSMGSSASTDNTNFGIIEGASVSNVNARNTTSVTASASVSGVTRLTFGLTTGQTSTKSGALGGTLVENTSDYGDDFTSGELDTIFLGKLRAGSGSSFNGHIKEALIYTTDQSSNRDAIEANIANYYNITLV